jgi:hypothetical protein
MLVLADVIRVKTCTGGARPVQKIYFNLNVTHTQMKLIHECSSSRDGICGNVIQSSVHRMTRQPPCFRGKQTMANVSRLIIGAAIAAVSVATPALAAHKGKPVSAHQNGYVIRSSQGSGVRAFASVPRAVDDPAVTGGGSLGYNANLRLNHW